MTMRPDGPTIVFDLSRLLSRADWPAPTGIDRVEHRYARYLISEVPERVLFVAVNAWGRLVPLPAPNCSAFLKAIETLWRDGERPESARRLGRLLRLRAAAAPEIDATRVRRSAPPVYLLASHHHLDRPAIFARLKRRTAARVVCLVHDLIPITHPEFARPGQNERHAQRMTTVARYADAVVVNSLATRDALSQFLERHGARPELAVAPLGVEHVEADKARVLGIPASPYFVCVGTIEPKKNHLLLLNVWRNLAAGPSAPHLFLVGRRGWENENAFDMLERCTALRGLVHEQSGQPDCAVATLLAGARALLQPSFAEGFGLPLAEALTQGVPAITSDIPVLREVGAGVPDCLDPLDGPGWTTAILDYAAPDSSRRSAQLNRLASWRAPRWERHFQILDALLEKVAG